MVKGVSEGFEKQLIGVGYRHGSGQHISLTLGFCARYATAAGCYCRSPQQHAMVLKSADKQLLDQVAAEILYP